MAAYEDEIFDWDSEIQKENTFILVPDGDYDFEVVKFERERYEGGEKIPPCPKAVVYFKVKAGDDDAVFPVNFYLCKKCEGRLSEFFIGIGEKTPGGTYRMNWNAVTGSKGRCKIEVRSWKDKDGNIKQSNDIKKFYEPVKKTGGGVFTPGKF